MTLEWCDHPDFGAIRLMKNGTEIALILQTEESGRTLYHLCIPDYLPDLFCYADAGPFTNLGLAKSHAELMASHIDLRHHKQPVTLIGILNRLRPNAIH